VTEKERCGTCRFWEHAAGDTGECHRYPPSFSPAQAARGGFDLWAGFFPETEAGEWCGEYRTHAAPTTPPA
jgi:hypothetical protein